MPQGPRPLVSVAATMGLCVVLYEQQAVASAVFCYFVRIGAATIEVHQQ